MKHERGESPFSGKSLVKDGGVFLFVSGTEIGSRWDN
jgi:hypothetical protein